MHPLLEKLYDHSPVALQDAMMSAYGWKLARLRYGGRFAEHVRELMRTEHFSAAELAELQRSRLRQLMSHCYENVPYYERLFRHLRLTPEDFRDISDLQKLPVLRKETVRQELALFHARNYENSQCEIVSTSGTSGTTLRIRVDVEGRRKNYAFFHRLKLWAGVDPKGRSATFAGRAIVPVGVDRPPFWRHNWVANALLFSSYHLSNRNMPAYLEKLEEWKPQLIDSYPSSIHVLAQYADEHGVPAPQPRAILTSSETLRADQRDVIGRVFRASIFDQYGSAEQVCFISQCEMGSYHVHPEFGVVEFLAENGNGEPLAGCKIVATGFTNWAMPLLRYDTGDRALPSNRSCCCGRNFPVVEQILGREDDLLVTTDGCFVGRLDPVFKGLQSIRQAQIVQESLDEVRVIVVPGNGYVPADEQAIRHELEKRLGRSMRLKFETTDEIPVGPGGKFRAVMSRVARQHVSRTPFNRR